MGKKSLNDILIIRPLAIFLLVVWHSFIIYTGGWKQPESFKHIETYWWIAKASYACMLELFVFISGYVFALGLEKKNPTLKNTIFSKFKRLIFPSLIFSIIYYIMFYRSSVFLFSGILILKFPLVSSKVILYWSAPNFFNLFFNIALVFL